MTEQERDGRIRASGYRLTLKTPRDIRYVTKRDGFYWRVPYLNGTDGGFVGAMLEFTGFAGRPHFLRWRKEFGPDALIVPAIYRRMT